MRSVSQAATSEGGKLADRAPPSRGPGRAQHASGQGLITEAVLAVVTLALAEPAIGRAWQCATWGVCSMASARMLDGGYCSRTWSRRQTRRSLVDGPHQGGRATGENGSYVAELRPVDALTLAERVLEVLGPGVVTTTYKFAVLAALIDLCLEKTRPNGAPSIAFELSDLARRVLELYWGQAAEFTGFAQRPRVPRQLWTRGEQAEVLTVIQ